MSFVRKNPSAAGIVYDNEDSGLSAGTIQQAIDQLALTTTALIIGSVWWIKPAITITIEDYMENIVTSPQLVEGTLVIKGRNTVL